MQYFEKIFGSRNCSKTSKKYQGVDQIDSSVRFFNHKLYDFIIVVYVESMEEQTGPSDPTASTDVADENRVISTNRAMESTSRASTTLTVSRGREHRVQ